MKKTLLISGALLVLTAAAASAAPGLDIAWVGATAASYCPIDAGALLVVSDLCDDNSVAHEFALAFKAPAGLSKLVALTFHVDVQTANPGLLPQWWHLEDQNNGLGVPAGCRGWHFDTGVPSSFAFNTSRGFGTTATCKDFWGGNKSGGTSWSPGLNGPNSTRLSGFFARSTAEAGAVFADVEYYVGIGLIDDNHAVADATTVPPTEYCEGCQSPACIVFSYLLLQQPVATPGGDVVITNGNMHQTMTWQGGAFSGSDCPAATPILKATWGRVKSLYR